MRRAVSVRVVTYLGGLDARHEGQYQLLPGDTLQVEPYTYVPGSPYLYVNPVGGPLIPLRPHEWAHLRDARLCPDALTREV
jgi:hypothetical protein